MKTTKNRLDPEVYRHAARLLCDVVEEDGGWIWSHLGACYAIELSAIFGAGCITAAPYQAAFRSIFAPNLGGGELNWFWWAHNRMDEEARCQRIIALELAALLVEEGYSHD